MAKKKYYVVWKGLKPGIYKSWKECEKNIKAVKGAQYKSFTNEETAKKAFKGRYEDYKGKKNIKPVLNDEEIKRYGNPILNTISVDAACSGNPGKMEYQCVETKTKELIFHRGPFEEGTNNIGEFLGLVHALALMKKRKDQRPIYTDSKIAMSWVRKKTYNTSVKKTSENEILFDLMERACIWLKNNTIENEILKWETKVWGEIPADFGRK